MDGTLDLIQGLVTVIVLLPFAVVAEVLIVGAAAYLDGRLPTGDRNMWL